MTAPTQAIETPSIGESPQRIVLYRHVLVPHEQLGQTFERVFGELYAAITRAGVAPAGPPFAIYHEQSEPGIRWDMDICAPISEPITVPAGLELREMPSERIVSFLHRGAYDSLDEAYRVLDAFIAEHDLTMTGGPREIYLSEPDVPAAAVLTQIEYPIA